MACDCRKSNFVLLLLQLLITVLAGTSFAQDEKCSTPPEKEQSSPFDPPTVDAFMTDDGPGLDTGCTFNSDPEYPLIIDVYIDSFVGEVDADGYLVDPGSLIARGVIPASVSMIMPAYDVDYYGTPPPERDEVLFNGESMGFLHGDNNIWLLNTFNLDISQIRFPSEPPAGADPIPVANRIQINVDTLSYGRWCTSIDWVALIIPIRPEVGVTVDIVTGNRVCDNNSGNVITTIYRDVFDDDCIKTVEIGDFNEAPFSGPARSGWFGWFSGQAILHFKLVPCPVASLHDPEVKVEWAINGTSLHGQMTWTGLEGDVSINMPNVIGSYTVEFRVFTNGEETSSFTRKLFVTWKEPLAQVDPPRIAWYEKATAWAAGQTEEDGILSGLLNGLYAYGNNLTYVEPTCTWSELVSSPIACSRGNCYVFSDIFENMAATLGVGGLGSVMVDEDYGFVTASAGSLDPQFPGNVRQFDNPQYDRYLFSTHSLRSRGFLFSSYYDATFNRIYSSEREFVSYVRDGGNGEDTNGLYYTTDEGAKIYDDENELNPPYDGWGSWKFTAPPALLAGGIPEVDGEFAGLSVARHDSDNFAFVGTAQYHLIDDEGDGIIEALAIDVDVTVTTAGTFTFMGSLERGNTHIASRPRYRSMLLSRARVTADPGPLQIRLEFSGEAINESELDGPYQVAVLGIATDGHAEFVGTTPAYTHMQFGESPATIVGAIDSGIDEDGDGLFDFVEVAVQVNVRESGSYFLQGSLVKSDLTIVNAGEEIVLAVGAHTVILRLPGRPIRRSGIEGPYDAVVALISATKETLGSHAFQTQAYNIFDFDALLIPEGALQDQGIDTNGNGLYDVLRVAFTAAVTEPGEYLLSGTLGNESESSVVFSSRQMNLVPGLQTIVIDFQGNQINAQDLDGPYLVEVALRDPLSLLERERILLDSMTSVYTANEFDPYGLSEIMLTGNSNDYGEDLNGDGLFDLLHIDVEVALMTSDYYEWSARLVDVNGTELGFYASEGPLSEGVAGIEFVFDGESIGQNGVNGPYYVNGLLMFGLNGANLVATDVAETQPYRVSVFEGALVGCIWTTLEDLAAQSISYAMAWGDYDNDGDPDLLVANDGPNHLYENVAGVLTLVPDWCSDSDPSYGAAWGDYDNDGDLDLYVVNDGVANALYRNDAGTFTRVDAGDAADTGRGYNAAWADYDNDGDLDLYVCNRTGTNHLYRNDDTVFVGVGGVTEVSGTSRGCAFADYDNDGDQDLYVSRVGVNYLFRNDGGVFVDVSAAPVNDAGNGKGVAWGDYDNDGDLDLYLVNTEGANRLFRNDFPGGIFTDVTDPLTGDADNGRACAWADYNNDGWLDLFLANHTGGNHLFHNIGAAFVDSTCGALAAAADLSSWGCAFADYDLDGDQDLAVAIRTYEEPTRLFRNDLGARAGRNWLQVDLRGVNSNRFGVGARITIDTGDLTLVREVSASGGYLGQAPLTASFGLAGATLVDVTVNWPSGIVQELTDVPVNRLIEVTERAGATATPELPRSPLLAVSNFPNPFNPSTTFELSIPRDAVVDLQIIDANGRLVRRLLTSEPMTAGIHQVQWQGLDDKGALVSSGVYFYRCQAAGESVTGRMVLLK